MGNAHRVYVRDKTTLLWYCSKCVVATNEKIKSTHDIVYGRYGGGVLFRALLEKPDPLAFDTHFPRSVYFDQTFTHHKVIKACGECEQACSSRQSDLSLHDKHDFPHMVIQRVDK